MKLIHLFCAVGLALIANTQTSRAFAYPPPDMLPQNSAYGKFEQDIYTVSTALSQVHTRRGADAIAKLLIPHAQFLSRLDLDAARSSLNRGQFMHLVSAIQLLDQNIKRVAQVNYLGSRDLAAVCMAFDRMTRLGHPHYAPPPPPPRNVQPPTWSQPFGRPAPQPTPFVRPTPRPTPFVPPPPAAPSIPPWSPAMRR